MYGTIARIRPKGGDTTALRALLDEWNQQRRPEVPGAHEGYLFVPDAPGPESPAQHAWYLRLREQLGADPDWMDGTFTPA